MDPATDFDQWCDRVYRRVLSAVIVICVGDLEQAEDATNEAFILAYKRWGRVREMESPEGWVTVVASNRAKSSWLRNKRLVELVNDHVPSSVDDVKNLDLWAAVDRLPVKQRRAVMLRYINDLSQKEIASKLDVAPGTVAATLAHARGNLRTDLTNREKQ